MKMSKYPITSAFLDRYALFCACIYCGRSALANGQTIVCLIFTILSGLLAWREWKGGA